MTNDEYTKSIAEKYYPWMSDEQFKCFVMLCDLVGGAHHLPTIKVHGDGIRVSLPHHTFATYDFNGLTTLVLMAHDRCIRAEIEPSSPGRLGVVLHKRKGREGRIHEKHPTISDAIYEFNKRREG